MNIGGASETLSSALRTNVIFEKYTLQWRPLIFSDMISMNYIIGHINVHITKLYHKLNVDISRQLLLVNFNVLMLKLRSVGPLWLQSVE